MNLQAQLETAISNSTASDYDKGNILYLAEALATANASQIEHDGYRRGMKEMRDQAKRDKS